MVRTIADTLPRAVPPIGGGGSVRLTGGDPSVIFGGAGDTQFSINEEADSFTFQSGSNANVFTPRLEFFSANHANAFDVVLYDGDGTTPVWTWDESADEIIFGKVARFTAESVPWRLGGAGDAQLEYFEFGDQWFFRTGSNANVWTNRVIYNTADHANAHDIEIRASGGAAAALWDNSASRWHMQAIDPSTDVARDLGSATLTWRDLYIDKIKDRAGTTVWDIQANLISTAPTIDTDMRVNGTITTTEGNLTAHLAFGWSGGTNFKHSLQTRHNGAGDANNAIDFKLWDHGTDATGTLGTFTALTLDQTGSDLFTALSIDQPSTTGAQPVLTLDQADVDEDFFKFIGTSDTSADRALVDAADFSTIGALKGYLKINIQDDQATNPIVDGDYYIPFYAVPTA